MHEQFGRNSTKNIKTEKAMIFQGQLLSPFRID